MITAVNSDGIEASHTSLKMFRAHRPKVERIEWYKKMGIDRVIFTLPCLDGELLHAAHEDASELCR